MPIRLLSDGSEVADVVEKVLPGVVQVLAASSTGTGFIISADGLVVTNRHVVGVANRVQIGLTSGIQVSGQVTFTHSRLDLAYIQIETRQTFTALPIGDSEAIRLGEDVIAIGYPLGSILGRTPTVSVGILSAKRPDLLQTDAALNPGNSGGPLVNTDGEVVGVVVSRLEHDTQGRPVAGVGFAIPINEVDPEVRGKAPLAPSDSSTPLPASTPGVPTPTPAPTPTPMPYWDVTVEADPVTDEQKLIIGTYAVEHNLKKRVCQTFANHPVH